MAGENVCEGIVCACECPLQTCNLFVLEYYIRVHICVCIYADVYTHTSHISLFPMKTLLLFFLDVHVLSNLRHQTNRSSESRMMLPMCGMRPFFCSTDIY